MNWEDLNKDNIEEVKEKYSEYLLDFTKGSYRALAKTFEEFYTTELGQCERCGRVVWNGESLCICCYDDMKG